MGHEEIKKLLDNSKKVLQENYEAIEKSIKDDLHASKKKAMD